jgi:hypothetical protein
MRGAEGLNVAHHRLVDFEHAALAADGLEHHAHDRGKRLSHDGRRIELDIVERLEGFLIDRLQRVAGPQKANRRSAANEGQPRVGIPSGGESAHCFAVKAAFRGEHVASVLERRRILGEKRMVERVEVLDAGHAQRALAFSKESGVRRPSALLDAALPLAQLGNELAVGRLLTLEKLESRVLQRGFDGFRAGAEKQHVVLAIGFAADALGEGAAQLLGRTAAGPLHQERASLVEMLECGAHHGRVVVPEEERSGAAYEVERSMAEPSLILPVDVVAFCGHELHVEPGQRQQSITPELRPVDAAFAVLSLCPTLFHLVPL